MAKNLAWGPLWVEFFVSLLLARAIQGFWLTEAPFWILLPVVWGVLHLLFGAWIEKNATKDLLSNKSAQP